MANINAWQVGTSTTVSYSWTADSNSWWSVEVYQNGVYIDEYSAGGSDGRTSGSGSFYPDDYGTFNLKLYTTPGGYVATASVTTVAPAPTTCECLIYLNGSFDHKETLDTGSSYYFGQFFWPFNNVSLTELQTNLDNYRHTVHSYESFTAPDDDFSIFYVYSDLNYDYTTTSNSITIQLSNISIPDANTYTWTLNGNSLSGTQVTFQVTAGNYTIYLSIKDSRSKEIGKGSASVSIASSNLWIYNGRWTQVTPWIYTNNRWTQVTAYVYNGGWKQC